MKAFINIFWIGLALLFLGNMFDISKIARAFLNESTEQDNTFQTMDDEIFSELKTRGYSTSLLSEYQSVNEFCDANIGEKTKYFDGKTIVKLKGYLGGDHFIDRKRGTFTIYNNCSAGFVRFSEGESIEISYKDVPDIRKYIVNKNFEKNYVLVKGNVKVYRNNYDDLYIDAKNIIFIPIK